MLYGGSQTEVRWNRHPYWMGAVAVGMTIATGDERVVMS